MKDAKKLSQRIKKTRDEETDTWPTGAVVRWQMATHRGVTQLTYVALKVGDVWYTTSTGSNRSAVPQIVSYGKLVKYLSSPACTLVEVAEVWSVAYEARKEETTSSGDPFGDLESLLPTIHNIGPAVQEILAGRD